MNDRSASSRRRLLAVSSLLCVIGCTPAPEEAGEAPGPRAVNTAYREAPELAARVAAGDLPPVATRLPQNPLVVQPVERLGRYGGTWHMAMAGTEQALDRWLIWRTLGYENLVRWDPQWRRVVSNLAQSYEVNEDATVFTFYLREGVRWSDGAPFTADDILFWAEDVLSNKELKHLSFPWLSGADDSLVVEKQDDYTVTFRFSSGRGLLLQHMAQPIGRRVTHYPSHYLRRFHPRHNPDGIDSLVAAHGAKDWVELFNQKLWPNPDAPTLFAWQLTGEPRAGRLVAERNPYYWKIDPAGRQLPYIDRLVYRIVPDRADAVDLALNGEVGMQSRYLSSVEKRPALEQQQRAGYRLFAGIRSSANRIALSFNLTHPDPARRAIFQNKDFRIALSHALDRQAILDEVYGGAGEPYQVAPPPGSPLYHEQLARQYTAYAPDRARAYLDRAGLARRDAEGFRLGPDDRRLVLHLEVWVDSHRKVVPQIQRYWSAVGLDIKVRVNTRAPFDQRRGSSLYDAVLWVGGGGLDAILDPRYYFPFSHESVFATAWALWYEDPAHPGAQEPPETARRQMELYDALKTTPDPARQTALMRQILDLAADAFYVIGIARPARGFGIVKNNFHNVPPVMPLSWVYPDPAPTHPAQYFIE